MKGMIGMRAAGDLIRRTLVHRFDEHLPYRPYTAILDVWSVDPARVEWLCAAGDIASLGTTQVSITPPLDSDDWRQDLAASTPAFLDSARSADCDFAAIFSRTEQWHYWKPMAQRQIELAVDTLETMRRIQERISLARRQFTESANMAGRAGAHLRKDVREEMAKVCDEMEGARNKVLTAFPQRFDSDSMESMMRPLKVHVRSASTTRALQGCTDALDSAEKRATAVTNVIHQRVTAALNAAEDCPAWQPRA